MSHAQRRDASGRLKRAMDLAAAQGLIEALSASESFALEDALAEAAALSEKGWRTPLARSLREIGLSHLLAD